MFSWFRGLLEQLATMLARAAARELETEALARHAERHAELLRQAARYEAEGLAPVAAGLRRHAEAVGQGQPSYGLLPTLAEGQTAPNGALVHNQVADSPTGPLAPSENAQVEPAVAGRKKGR